MKILVRCPHGLCYWIRELGYYFGINRLKLWDVEVMDLDPYTRNNRIFY